MLFDGLKETTASSNDSSHYWSTFTLNRENHVSSKMTVFPIVFIEALRHTT